MSQIGTTSSSFSIKAIVSHSASDIKHNTCCIKETEIFDQVSYKWVMMMLEAKLYYEVNFQRQMIKIFFSNKMVLIMIVIMKA